ncbi:MAG: hypothetical protein IT233_09495 [Bacteroidia bacterium]|nr:hypothetical protein [Bacteroidia bacterium]
MKAKLDRLWFGLTCGIAGPVLLFSVYHWIQYGQMGLERFADHLSREGTLSPRISLCVILNLGLFFTFYWTKMDKAAKGIIAATFLFAFLIVYLKVIR